MELRLSSAQGNTNSFTSI